MLAQVEKIIEIPVTTEKRVEVAVPYERVVHIQVPVEKIVYKDVPVPVQMNPVREVTKEIPRVCEDSDHRVLSPLQISVHAQKESA